MWQQGSKNLSTFVFPSQGDESEEVLTRLTSTLIIIITIATLSHLVCIKDKKNKTT